MRPDQRNIGFNSQYSPIFPSDESISWIYLCPYPIIIILSKNTNIILYILIPPQELYTSFHAEKNDFYHLNPFFSLLSLFPGFWYQNREHTTVNIFSSFIYPSWSALFCFSLPPEYLGHHDKYWLKKLLKITISSLEARYKLSTNGTYSTMNFYLHKKKSRIFWYQSSKKKLW